MNEFCVDITARAAEGKIDPVIGRDKEVQRVVQILARRTKNNPILLGEPGVGKTAIAEGLAMRIVGGDVPEFLSVSLSADCADILLRITCLFEYCRSQRLVMIPNRVERYCCWLLCPYFPDFGKIVDYVLINA